MGFAYCFVEERQARYMKKGYITSIEITDAHVKLLQARALRDSQLCLVTCEVKTLEGYTDEEVFSSLQHVVHGKQVQADALIVALPRQKVIIKHFKLPSQSETEIKKMVSLQLVDKIPYAMDDVVYDIQVLNKDNSGYSLVMVVVVQNEDCSKYLSAFQKLGLSLNRLTMSSFGEAEWWRYMGKQRKVIGSQPAMIMNIDTKQSEICFCDSEKWYYSRSIAYGAIDLTEENMIDLVQQASLSLQSYEKEEMGPTVKKVVICSTIKKAAEYLKARLEEKLKIQVDVISALDYVLCQKNINLSTLKDQIGISLTVPLGLMMAEPKRLMNFMPKEIHQTKRSRIIRRQFIQTTALAGLVVILFFLFFWVDVFQQNAALGQLKETAGQIEVQLDQAKHKMDFVKHLEGEFQGRRFLSDIITELYRLTPKDISFRSLSLDERGELDIQGYATAGASVNQFQRTLVSSSVFRDVNLQFATQRQIYNMDVTDFKITANIK